MAKNLKSWNKYKKSIKEKVLAADNKKTKTLMGAMAVDLARTSAVTHAMLLLLLKKKIITKKEVSDLAEGLIKKGQRKLKKI